MTLSFRRRGPYFEQSECGHYTVAAIYILGKLKFEAWRREQNGRSRRLGDFPSASAAREACESDAQRAAA